MVVIVTVVASVVDGQDREEYKGRPRRGQKKVEASLAGRNEELH